MELSPETRDELNAEVGYEKYGLTLSEDDVFCPIENPQTAKWDLALSDKDVVRILEGYDPERMEDRWALRADGPDEMGNIVFHAYRSWTGNEIIRLQVTAPRFRTSGTPSTAEAKVEREGQNENARVTEITWETAPDICRPYTEDGTKKQAFGFCKYWLGFAGV
ncbi:unnamed protein product [Colletotrichum noveboracense]|uniref:Uncharacterized protein n=1 Tax=Colletotrichum noveboracense TaxID=2664923 RepID=A0A9W4WEH2_9PEZI|nr:unnamed protein product [Colletotrichum noveboracense]